MKVELYFLKKRCPSCNGDNVVAMYEQCYSNEKRNWYPGCCGNLCLDCGWMKETDGRMGFGWYTGKYCTPYNVELNSGEWDEDAVRIVKQMKNCDGDMDVAAAMRDMAQRRKKAQQQEADRKAKQAADARRRAQQEADRQRQIEMQRALEAENRRQELLRQQELERLRQERERQRLEYERQEAARLAREEAARRAREEAERKAREAQNRQMYNQLVAQGKAALQANRRQEALNNFKRARTYWSTWELRPLIAQILAQSSNANEHAQAIIDELVPYFNWKQEQNQEVVEEQRLWLARAYVDKGDKSSACTQYFLAGDKAYDAKNYTRADEIYNESLKKTDYYESSRHLFRLAYARSESKKPLPEADHRYCISRYRQSLEKAGDDDMTRNNLAWHYNELGEYQNAVDICLPAAQRGKEPLAFDNLAWAYYKLEKWAEAERWYERSAQSGKKRNHFRIGYARMEQGKDALAEQDFLKSVQAGEYVRSSYWNLGHIARKNGKTRQAAEYHLKELQTSNETQRHERGEKLLKWTENDGYQDIVAAMLNLLPWIKTEREEAARKAREEMERIAREKAEAERKAREEAERKAREEAERIAREKAEAERKAREEEDLLLLTIL